MKPTSVTLSELLRSDLRYSNGMITSDMSVDAVRRQHIGDNLLKKYLGPSRFTSAMRKQAAIELWTTMNERCSTSFQLDATRYIHDVLLDARELMYKSLNSWTGPRLKLQDCVAQGRFGPGASAGTRATTFLDKLGGGPLTTKIGDRKLYDYFTRYTDCRWQAVETARLGMYGSVKEERSKVFTVPKSTEIDRVALKEPSLAMFFQLGLGEQIKQVLKRSFNFDLSTQPVINRRMAKRGSIDGSFATIDLKSASDTISCTLVHFLIDKHNLQPFLDCRSDVADVEGVTKELLMFSSMGNGFTFPLQTLIFSTLCRAAYRSLGLSEDDLEGLPAFSVFGDDIVVRREAYHRVVSLLEYCGFIVNSEKSYNEGYFRESCGHDYYRGEDVRSVYLRELSSHADFYSAFNRLCRWCVRHGIYLTYTLRALFESVPFRPVPFDCDDTAGFHWPSSDLTTRKRCKDTGGLIYRPLVVVARQRRLTGSENGFMIAALGGFLTGGKHPFIGLRAKEPVYKVGRAATSSWDWIPDARVSHGEYRTLLSLVAE